MSKSERSGTEGSPPPSFDDAGVYLVDSASSSDDNSSGSGSEGNSSGSGSEGNSSGGSSEGSSSGSDSEDNDGGRSPSSSDNNGGGSGSDNNGGGSGSEALALPGTSSFFAVPAMISSASLFAPPPILQRTSSCHTSSPASSMAASPQSVHAFMSAGAPPSLLLRQPSNQSDISLHSPVLFRDGGSLSQAPDHTTFDTPQHALSNGESSQLAAENVVLSQRLMQLEAELRTLKPQTEHQHGNSFAPIPHLSTSAAEARPPLPTQSPATIGFLGVPVLDFTALWKLPATPAAVPVPIHVGAAADAPFVFASAKFGNEVTLLGEGNKVDQRVDAVKLQEQPTSKPYVSSVEDLRLLIKQQQKELDYFTHAHKSVAVQQGRQQLAALEKARADSAEALVLQLQRELSSASSALSVAESALRSDTAFRSALVRHFPDLTSASAVISRMQEAQQRQLQLEAELCAAKQNAAAASASAISVTAQLSSANAHQQQQDQQRQVLLQKLHKAEAAAAAAAAAAEARQSVVKMFDFEKFVEEKREIPVVKAEAEAAKKQQQELTLKLEAANLRLDEEKRKQEQCHEQLKEQEQVIERMRAEIADANKKAEAATAAAASSVDSATVLAAAAAATEIESLKTVVKELKEKEQSAQLAAAAELLQREEQHKKQLEDLQHKLDVASAAAAAATAAASAPAPAAAVAVAVAVAAAPSVVAAAAAAGDASTHDGGESTHDGGDEERKRMRMKAEMKIQRLQQQEEAEQKAATTAAPAAASSGVSPPHSFKGKKRAITITHATVPPSAGISLSDIRSQ